MLERKNFTQRENVPLADLIEIQKESYQWFFNEGIKELFEELNPIEDFTGKNYQLTLDEYSLDPPKVDEETARYKNLTYKAPLRVKTTLYNKITKKTRSSEIFLGDFPLMTPRGTFIINGIERVIVNQIVRSYGVLFAAENFGGKKLFGAKIIPARGAWLEFETSARGVISVKIDRKRKIPVTTFLKAIGGLANAQIVEKFADVDTGKEIKYIEATLARDPAKTYQEALVEVYKRIRPGDLTTAETAKLFIEAMFFNYKRYSLGKVGRFKMNRRLNLNASMDEANLLLKIADVIETIKEIIRLNNDEGALPDDVDHLKNRRVRAVGELVQTRLRVGLLRMERIIKDRMSVLEADQITPSTLINNRPILAVLQEFFASSQLSQFMDQTNPLAELEHKRRIAATGPGGLSRERASFEVRDVHNSHYGRICPIATPEGPNIGLVAQLATYAKVNPYGFIETPYFKIEIGKNKKARVTDKLRYFDAFEEEKHVIAPASTLLDSEGYIKGKKVIVRVKGEPQVMPVEKLEYFDVSPRQIVSVSAALIAFIEHDEAVRASMGTNMLKQAVPLVKPEAPVVGTGMEKAAVRSSSQLMFALEEGKVVQADAEKVVIKGKTAREYKLQKFIRSNQGTSINERPVVKVGDFVKKGQLLADSSTSQRGELALGQNLLVAFMSFAGANYEDAIIVSERLVRDDILTSIHIEKYICEVRDTKLGPEIVTRDIPNVGEEALSELDESGIVRVGASVEAGDILVGKITPKGESELTAEEKLLRAIFGEKAKDVTDTSLRLPHGEYGKIVSVKVFSKDAGDELITGVYKVIEVAVAQLRKISVGDKLAGRHGNKGVISKILPAEDMPRLPDGTPVDIILNPLGVVSRMNLGQIMESQLGWAAVKLGFMVESPVFQSVPLDKIKELSRQANLPEDSKIPLYDGRTGEPFDSSVTVGIIYMMKLIHLVDDKIHARSTGPYSMATQQPLGGKAQFGGQRFGEMEVWALEAYGAAHSLQEMLTIKSDDVVGRSKAYEAIIKGEEIQKPTIPASFYVLVRELQSLGLSIQMLKDGQLVKESVLAKAPIQNRQSIVASIENSSPQDEEKVDRQVTEIYVGQEKNPPKASAEEVMATE